MFFCLMRDVRCFIANGINPVTRSGAGLFYNLDKILCNYENFYY